MLQLTFCTFANICVLSYSAATAHAQKPPTPPPDSPTLLTTAAGLPHLQLPGGPARSDTSTPSFVKTTMEVADTAAQIDARTPDSEAAEHEVPDSSIDVSEGGTIQKKHDHC